MEMPTVSIIIPVYNASKFIPRCIDSILKQSFKNFEVILINDGSLDNSLEILKFYEDNYKFIHVINQSNRGPAIARNMGILASKGEYIMFIDADDYIDEHYIKNYIKYKNNYDVIIGGYKKVNDERILYTRQLDKDGEFARYVVTGPYCHLYRKSFLEENNIIFHDTLMSEDVYFNLEIFSYNPICKVISDISYNYYTNLNSISNTSHKGFNEKIDFTGFVSGLLQQKPSNYVLHQYFIIRYIIWYLLYSGKNVSPCRFYEHYMKYFNRLNKNIPNFNKNKYIKILGPSGEIKKIGFIVRTFIKLHQLKLIKLFSKIYCKGKLF